MRIKNPSKPPLQTPLQILHLHNIEIIASYYSMHPSFLTKHVVFLEYMVSNDGLVLDTTKVETINQWPLSTTVMEVFNFHCHAFFYRRFISHFSSIMESIMNLLRQGDFIGAFKQMNHFG